MRLCMFCLAFSVAAYARADEVYFAGKPTVTKVRDGFEIRFAASRETDVEVVILDDRDNVVRHLAAGVLSDTSDPPSPLKPGLAQGLVWDGKNDNGEATPRDCRVKVSLGMTATLERVFGFEPTDVFDVYGIAADAHGHLYVLHGAGTCIAQEAHVEITVFDRHGRYLKTVSPPPADLSYERLKPLGALRLGDGRVLPLLYGGQQRCFLPELGRAMVDIPPQTMAVTGDGELSLANPRQVLLVGADGGVAGTSVLGPKFREEFGKGRVHLATSPDGRWIYVSGQSGSGPQPGSAVYRLRLEQKDLPQPFLDEFREPGGDVEPFGAARGIAVDATGNVLVADEDNDRIAVFSPDGRPLAAIPVDKPQVVAVHPKTGAVYTACDS